MFKVVSDKLIVLMQLMVGSIFLLFLFYDNESEISTVVISNDNLYKMSDSVSLFFDKDNASDDSLNIVSETGIEDVEVELVVEDSSSQVVEESDFVEVDDTSVIIASSDKVESDVLSYIDSSIYNSKPDLGFIVSTDNKVYDLSDDDFYSVASKVQCESHTNKDDILAVISVILNRADMCYSGNCDPVSVVWQPNQFVCKASEPNENVISVVKDALSGVRNNSYISFRSWGSTSYSDKYIVDGGNRYK